MGDSLLRKKPAQLLGGLDGDGANQHRLSLGVRLLHRLHDGVKLFLSGLVDRVLMILSRHRPVGGDLNHIHPVNIAEFSLLREGRTGHARFLLKFIKKVLECDGRQGLALPLHLHMLLGLDGLMQTVGVASSRHDTAGELIHDQHLLILHHIVLIPEHEVVCPKGQYNIMLDLDIFGICKVFDLEELLHLPHALGGEIDHLVLFIDDEIPGLLSLHTHDGVHFGELLHVLAAL